MRAVCPNCQTGYEIEPERLPAPRIRLRCNRCDYIFPFHLESQSVEEEPARASLEPEPAEGFASPGREEARGDFPAAEEGTPAETTATAILPRPAYTGDREERIVYAEEVSSEFHLPRNVDLDDRTERATIPSRLGRWLGMAAGGLALALLAFFFLRPRAGGPPLEYAPDPPKLAPAAGEAEEIPAQETVPSGPPAEEAESEVLRILDATREADTAPERNGKKPKSALPAPPKLLGKGELAPYAADYAKFTPSSLERLRQRLETPMREANPDPELLLMAAEAHSYLGKRTEQKSWIDYGYKAAFRYRSRQPEDVKGTRALALAYAAARQLRRALPLAREAVTLRPDDPVARYAYGLALGGEEGKREGLEALEHARGRFPGSYPVAEALAAGYLETGEYAKARKIARELLAKEPNDLPLKGILALAYEGEEKWLETAGLLEEVVKRNRKWSYRLSLARALRKSGRAQEARRLLEGFTPGDLGGLTPEQRALVTAERGKLEFDENRFGPSIVHFREAAKQNPKDSTLLQYLAGALFREKRYREAAEIYRKAAAAEPGNVSLKRFLGMSCLEGGDFDGAEKAFAEVIRGGEENASLDYHMARVREAKGDRSGAIAYLERALTKDPNYTNAKIRLQKLLGR